MTNQRRSIMVVNAQGASAPTEHTTRVAKRSLKVAAEFGVDFIAWSEVAEIWLPQLTVDMDELKSYQFGTPWQDEPVSGLAASWNPHTGDFRGIHTLKGSDATSEGSWKTGSGIRERPILRGKYNAGPWDVNINVIHPPPLRAPVARWKYMSRALKLPGILVGDTNFIRANLLRMRGRRNRKIKSAGLLAIFVPRRFHVSKITRVDVGSDHDAFIVTIEPKRARKARLKKEKKA